MLLDSQDANTPHFVVTEDGWPRGQKQLFLELAYYFTLILILHFGKEVIIIYKKKNLRTYVVTKILKIRKNHESSCN